MNFAEDWKTTFLGSLADFRNGINFSSTNMGTGIKVIGVADFQNYMYPMYDLLGEINPEGVVRDEDLLAENDIVFVRSNGNRNLIGRTLYISNLPYPVTHSGFTIRLRFMSDKVYPPFFAQFFHSSLARDAMAQQGSGTNISNLSQQILQRLQVPLPPLAEQRRIAEILGTWDDAITLTGRLIDALKHRKQGMMQRLLTGEVRQSWTTTTLAEAAQIILSNVDKVTDDGETAVRLCNYMDVYKNSYLTNSMQFMDGSASEAEIRKFALHKHDVLITKDSETAEDIAEAAVVTEDLDNVICGYHLAILRADASMLFGPFLRELLLVPDIHHQFIKAANGITRFGLTYAGVREIQIPVPPLDYQYSVAEVLESSDQFAAGLEMYIELLTMQKKGLMQQLLTGQIRVGV